MYDVMLLWMEVMWTRPYHSDYVMACGQWILSKQGWWTSGYYDLASIVMLYGINVESIAMLQWTKAEKRSEVCRWWTI